MSERKDARWFVRWAAWMQGTLVRPDWPAPEMGYWAELERKLEGLAVTEREATVVVRAMFGKPFFVDQFVKEFTDQLRAERRSATQGAASDPGAFVRSLAESDRAAAHAAECERVWSGFDDDAREAWRSLVRRRMPVLRGRTLELLAMAWAAFPDEIPPEAPPRPPGGRGPRHALPDRKPAPWDHSDPRAALVLAREEEAKRAAIAPPSPPENPDESSDVST